MEDRVRLILALDKSLARLLESRAAREGISLAECIDAALKKHVAGPPREDLPSLIESLYKQSPRV